MVHWRLTLLTLLTGLTAQAIEVSVQKPDAQLMATWNKSEPFLDMSTRFKRKGGLADFRMPRFASDFVSIDPSAKPLRGTLSLARTELDFSAMVFQTAEATARLGFLLPINNVKASNPDAPSGSEFGGLGVRFLGNYGSSFQYELAYADRKSSKLKLYDPHYEVSGGFYLTLNENIDGNIPAKAAIGPEIAVPLQPGQQDVVVDYGLQWGARAKLEAESGQGTMLNFRYGMDLLLRRASAYGVANIEQGGAGLFAVTPSVDYRLLENAWIGFAAEIPVFRPVNREVAFGNIGLPALFGTSFGLRFSASAL